MNSKLKNIISVIATITITLGLFGLFSLFQLEHLLAFILPVPLAVLIVRYEVKDAIIPGIILVVLAPFVSQLIHPGLWTRGLIIMPTALIVGVLHGWFSKTKMNQLVELLLIIAADVTLGFIMALSFYLLKDPHFSLAVEFTHFFEFKAQLLNLQESTNAFINIKFLVMNTWVAYVVLLGLFEALFTHSLIHIITKYSYGLTIRHIFSGLDFSLRKKWAILFLVLISINILHVLLFNFVLTNYIRIVFAIMANITAIMTIVFVLQGIVVLIHLSALKLKRNLTLLIFVSGLVLFPFTMVLGILDAFLDYQGAMLPKVESVNKNYFAKLL